ncbi:MAG: ABC-F family ATP-binding cassette domain-containing protein [Fimbriimonadaceae bacterium]|nr:MAG: ABC-F family ATP-binding cassette domain-containing protein [Fimbriimonadaceae bacterium]
MILSVANLRKLFGVDIILDSVTFRIEKREKVALVGRNGTGKTTLLKLITQQLEPDRGSVNLQRGAKVGYLRQEHPVTAGRTVLQEAQSGLEHLLEIKTRLDELTKILENNPTDDDFAEFALLHEHFNDSEGYSAERDVITVLNRMGFEEADFERITDSLSGGERTRLALARLLLEEPDLLILDEPTNHLDLQATEWLESWIKQYHGAILLVSHDRSFLENTATKFIELRNGTVSIYEGDFHKYLKLREEDEARQADIAAKQAQQIAKLDEFVRRFMNSQRTAQARGRQKHMHRLQEQQIQAPTKDASMRVGFGKVTRSGDVVIKTEKLSVGFPDETLFKDLDWEVRYGERWGIVGENGAGKSTLIKTILGRHKAVDGSAKLGSRVELGYFSQDVADLDLDDSPLDHMVFEMGMDAGPARNLLGRFLFSGEDVFRSIRSLSGGEKNKLVLASLTQINPNLLVLDEPTNHLDMDSRAALAEVLNEYKGTLVLISHDRWLLSQVTNRILDVRRSGPKEYLGGYTEYRRGTSGGVSKGGSAQVVQRIEPTLSPRELSKEIARMRQVVEDSENAVAKAEAEISRIENILADPAEGEDIRKLTEEYQTAQKTLSEAMTKWEEDTLFYEGLQLQQG